MLGVKRGQLYNVALFGSDPVCKRGDRVISWNANLEKRGICGNVRLNDSLSCSSDLSGQLIGNDTRSQIGGSCDNEDCYPCGTPFASLEQTNSEHIYSFRCQVSGSASIVLANMACDLDVYVLEERCGIFSTSEAAECVAGNTKNFIATDSLTFDCVAGETYFISVENTLGEASCSYDLAFDAGVNSACREDCNNGIDDDGNTAVDCADPVCSTDRFCR